MKRCVLIILITIGVLESAARATPAEDLYTQGQAAYDGGDFATAVTKWQAAYDLSKESGLLFNLAQARRLSGDCTGALATYRRFLAEDIEPASEQHKLAADLARELEGTCPTTKPVMRAPPKVVNPSNVVSGVNLAPTLNDRKPDRVRSGSAWKVGGLVIGGVGVATIGLGLGLGHRGATIGDEITAACRTSCDWAMLKDKDTRGKRDVAIGKALDVIGAAAVVGGAVFYYLGVRRDNEALTVAPSNGGAVMSWSGSW